MDGSICRKFFQILNSFRVCASVDVLKRTAHVILHKNMFILRNLKSAVCMLYFVQLGMNRNCFISVTQMKSKMVPVYFGPYVVYFFTTV